MGLSFVDSLYHTVGLMSRRCYYLALPGDRQVKWL